MHQPHKGRRSGRKFRFSEDSDIRRVVLVQVDGALLLRRWPGVSPCCTSTEAAEAATTESPESASTCVRGSITGKNTI